MTFASTAKAGIFPVTRSSKRAPSEINRSDFWIAVTAVYMPCMPGMPRCCSCESERASRHQRRHDRYAGTLREGEQLFGGVGLECSAPDVENRSLGLVDQGHRTGDGILIEYDLGTVAREGRTPRPFAGYHQSIIDWVTSLGTSMSTGPGRPVVAMWKGRRHGTGNLLGRLHEKVVLGDTHGDARDVALLKGVGAMADVATWPVITTNGVESMWALPIGVTMFVAPDRS